MMRVPLFVLYVYMLRTCKGARVMAMLATGRCDWDECMA